MGVRRRPVVPFAPPEFDDPEVGFSAGEKKCIVCMAGVRIVHCTII
jgi:hypothetical protein